jgi:hypothetical protein
MVMLKGAHRGSTTQASSRDWGDPGHARQDAIAQAGRARLETCARARGGPGRPRSLPGQPGRRRHAVMGVFLLRSSHRRHRQAGRPRTEEFAGPHGGGGASRCSLLKSCIDPLFPRCCHRVQETSPSLEGEELAGLFHATLVRTSKLLMMYVL